MHIEYRVHFRYGRKRNTAQTMARHSRCVVSSLRMVSVNDGDQYPTNFVLFMCCACINTHPTCTLQASVSRAVCPIEFGSARTSGDMSAFSSKFMNLNSSSLRGSNVFWSSFRSFAYNGPAIQEKFGTNGQETLYGSMKERSSEGLAGCCDPFECVCRMRCHLEMLRTNNMS